MAKGSSLRVSRSGTYVVKAAESRPAKVVASSKGRATHPSGRDKRAAQAFLKSKRG